MAGEDSAAVLRGGPLDRVRGVAGCGYIERQRDVRDKPSASNSIPAEPG